MQAAFKTRVFLYKKALKEETSLRAFFLLVIFYLNVAALVDGLFAVGFCLL